MPLDVAGIVFAETRRLMPDPAVANGVSDLRKALAYVVRQGGDGAYFAAPEEPTIADLGDPDIAAAWTDCIAAAKAPTRPPNDESNVAFFAAAPNFVDQYSWLPSATGVTSFGGALATDASGAQSPTKLWVMRAKTQSGRFPRTETDTTPYSIATPGIKNSAFGGILFLICLALLVYPAQRVWHVSGQGLTRLCSVAVVDKSKPPPDLDAACIKNVRALDAANTTLAQAVADDDGKTDDKKKAVETARDDVKTLYDGRFATPNNKNRPRVNIVPNFIGSLLGIVGLLMLIGYGMRSEVLGFLVDDRGRMSLSRFQFVAWTIVILAAYWIAAAWNLGLADAVASSVLPAMSTDLWILLGIVTTPPLVSTLIIGAKSQAPTDDAADAAANANNPPAAPVDPAVVDNRGHIDVRSQPNNTSYLDLFIGEEVANRSYVDISRVQQFIFTLVTLFAFGALVLKKFSALDPGVRITQLPPLDTSLVGLLAISHAAYLAAKTLPKTPKTPAVGQ